MPIPLQETPLCPCRPIRAARAAIRPVLEQVFATTRAWHEDQHRARRGLLLPPAIARTRSLNAGQHERLTAPTMPVRPRYSITEEVAHHD